MVTMKLRLRVAFLSILILCVLLLGNLLSYSASAQVTNTPVSVRITTNTPVPTVPLVVTDAPTRTPTPLGPIVARIKPDFISQNAYTLPELESEALGTLKEDTPYVVVARYFRWLRIQYDERRFGWIFDDYVDLIGDTTAIEEFDPYLEATAEVVDDGRIIDAPTSVSGVVVVDVTPAEGDDANTTVQIFALPTFTYPPNVDVNAVAVQPTREPQVLITSTPVPDTIPELVEDVLQNGVPPFVPIVGLGAIGLLGLLLSLLRR